MVTSQFCCNREDVVQATAPMVSTAQELSTTPCFTSTQCERQYYALEPGARVNAMHISLMYTSSDMSKILRLEGIVKPLHSIIGAEFGLSRFLDNFSVLELFIRIIRSKRNLIWKILRTWPTILQDLLETATIFQHVVRPRVWFHSSPRLVWGSLCCPLMSDPQLHARN